MRPQMIMFCYGVFIIGTLLSVTISGRWLAGEELNIINQLAAFNTVNLQVAGGWGVPAQLITFFDAIVTVLGWGYPYLDNSWGMIFKLVFLYPITIGVIITLVQLASAIIQGIAGTIKSLLPGV